MSLRKLLLGCVLFALAATLAGQQEHDYVVLPQSAGNIDSSWLFGDKVHVGSWMPSRADIDGLEANLSQISALNETRWKSGRHIEHPGTYHRQYIGVTDSHQRRFVYVNAFCEPPPSDWKTKLYVVIDGGACFWQAFYDPSTKKFSNLMINARA